MNPKKELLWGLWVWLMGLRIIGQVWLQGLSGMRGGEFRGVVPRVYDGLVSV